MKQVLVSCDHGSIFRINAELPTTCVPTERGGLAAWNIVGRLLTERIGIVMETHLDDRRDEGKGITGMEKGWKRSR
jgi:hypothetical protein